jgi:hypothetical protein
LKKVVTRQDLFLRQLSDAPFKDDRSLMEFPFFSLQKRPRFEAINYQDGDINISIQPGPKGIATIYDKDVLIYLASIISEQVERGEEPGRTVRFPAYDFLKTTSRGTGKRAYELFLDAIFRLRSTNISTSIASAGTRDRRGFGWIEDWRVLERNTASGRLVMAGVEITLNRWMFAAIVKDRRILTINPAYFHLKKGLERRLYEVARKHVGYQDAWYVGLPKLAKKCGSEGTTRKFKFRLAQISEHDGLPDYSLRLCTPSDIPEASPIKIKGPAVHFWPKRVAIQTSAPISLADTSSDDELTVSYDAYEEARSLFPGYDIQYLESRWQEWSATQAVSVSSPDKAFLAWCKRYAATNPL